MVQAHEDLEILKEVVRLQEDGKSFALATIVWRREPSSGQKSSRAIIHPTGQIKGWIGGACAEPVVIKEALKVLQSHESSLIWLGQPEELAKMHLPEGVHSIPMACQSEGSLQIYIEPVLSMPKTIVVGRSPMANTLDEVLRQISWRSQLVDVEDFNENMAAHADVVIVATQGHGDEDALATALKANSPYIGLIASRKRAENVRHFLVAQGHSASAVSTIHAPMGVDLGHTSHLEMAISVSAQLVQARSNKLIISQSDSPILQQVEVLDYVCGMTVTADKSNFPFEHDGQTYYFCMAGCRASFESNPDSYLKQEVKC